MQTVKSNVNTDGKGLPHTVCELPSLPPSERGDYYPPGAKHSKNPKIVTFFY